ncbi:MAG TPA: sigma-70 family RNA polymerase sigma factor [Tissierellaceae bacterium]|nr:sigma-70 family RNA polymerase sigma factor [Tissierellaceae bacterium]
MYKELNELLTKAREGDIDSKEKILDRLQGLIIKSIQRYYNNRNEYEDLIQEGNLAILEAIQTFDESKGVYFLGYVKTMLKYTYLNKHKIRTHQSLNSKIGYDEDNELIDILESNEDSPLDRLLKIEETSIIKDALSILTVRQREIVLAYYVEGLSISEIAERLNISYRTVINTKIRALEKMREHIR